MLLGHQACKGDRSAGGPWGEEDPVSPDLAGWPSHAELGSYL